MAMRDSAHSRLRKWKRWVIRMSYRRKNRIVRSSKRKRVFEERRKKIWEWLRVLELFS